MSVKRQATTELNHENWDQEDPDEHEEMGSFKTASTEVLEKRVIRTAKRRAPLSDEEPKKSVFSGFGFNKTQPSSFEFLSKLTNGSSGTNGTPNKAETSSTPGSSLFSDMSKPATSPSSGIFGIQTTKSPFGTTSTTQSGSLFGVPTCTSNTTPTSIFSTSKAESSITESPFKSQTASNTSDNSKDLLKTSTTPVSSPKFGIPSSNANVPKSLFTSSPNSSLFKIQPTTNTTTLSSTFGTATTPKSDPVPNTTPKPAQDSKKSRYYSKLKGLNESVSEWIKKNVEETPLCILSPIFKDYEKYLKEIQEEFHGPDEENKKSDDKTTISETKPAADVSLANPATTGNKGQSLFNMPPPSSKPSIFAPQNTSSNDKPGTFSFGINTSTSTSSTTTTPGFSFGITASSQSNTTSTILSSSPFAFSTNTGTNGGASSFSFGAGKPFSFNSNIQPQQNTEKTEEANDEDDAPPKVEFTPVVEENSVYDKRCKIFVKKDGNFVDKGVGTLYIKKIEDTGKHQLLIRANTNLGTILVNLILASAIPTQRMGKNNVMMVCIPTPDTKPPPTPILVRVKTPEEADELLETLNKYKS